MAETVEMYPLNLSERILDIMQEKGLDKKKLSEMAGIERMTLTRRLANRWIESSKKSEVKAIATALGISVQRLERKDSEEKEKMLLHLIKSGSHPQKAISMLREMDHDAIGYTEKMCFSLWKGIVLSRLEGGDASALEEIVRAIKFAKASKIQRNEAVAVNRLIIFFMEKREYDKMCELNTDYADIFKSDEVFHAKYLMNLAMCAYNEGDKTKAIEHFREAKSVSLKVGDEIQAIRIDHNIANILFLTNEFKESFTILKSIRQSINNDSINMQVLFLKDYSRSLIEFGLLDDAKKAIHNALGMIKLHHLEPNDIEGKILLYKSILERQPIDATKALTFKGLSKKTSLHLNYFLAKCHREGGDYQKSADYYENVVSFAPFDLDIEKLHRI